MPIGPSLNPLPPTKGASPATAIAAMSSSSTLPGSRTAPNTPLEARAASGPRTTPGPRPGGPAPSVTSGGTALYGVPIAPAVGVPMPGVPLPRAALPATAFPMAPAASVANSGSPLPVVGGMPAGGFPTSGVPGHTAYPQPVPTAAWPWPVGHVMPAGSPAPMSAGNAARGFRPEYPLFLPRSREPCPWPQRPSTIRRTPDSRFLMICFAREPTPLDELGLAASIPVAARARELANAGRHRQPLSNPFAGCEPIPAIVFARRDHRRGHRTGGARDCCRRYCYD